MPHILPANIGVTLDKVKQDQQIRLGIQGFGGTGKTTASLTFPNPVVANLNRGLGGHTGRADVTTIDFNDIAVCKAINSAHAGDVSMKNTFLTFLTTHAKKLESDQTLVIDCLTELDFFYHKWYSANPVVTKQGKEDDYAEYKLKIIYFEDVMAQIKSLNCHVILITHEVEKKDKDGSYSGKIRPILSGQFGDRMMGHFTDWFRQQSKSKPADFSKITPSELALWGMKNIEEYKAMCNTFSGNTLYFWQTEGDEIFDGKASSLVGFRKYIPATFESFKKYKRISPVK